MAIAPGTRLGPYEIVSGLGAGGMGEVYRARDARLGRDVALKILPADVSSDPERRARFEQEARAAAALNHPNILGIYDVGSDGQHVYIAAELIDGDSLASVVEDGPVPVRRLLDIAGCGPQLWMADTTSGERHAITSGTSSTGAPAVSPDGLRLILTGDVGHYDIVSVDLATAVPRKLIATARNELMPAWAAKQR